MSPELTKELIVGILSAFFTALFAGVPGIALFWWTYRRDQERLIVEKLQPKRATARTSSSRAERFGILVGNRSLFSVHLNDFSFEIDGKVTYLEEPRLPLRMRINPDVSSNRPYIADEDADPWIIPSQSSIQVWVRDTGPDRVALNTALITGAEAHGVPVGDFLNSPHVVARVATETGKVFTSRSWVEAAWRWLIKVKREMDGASKIVPTEPETG